MWLIVGWLADFPAVWLNLLFFPCSLAYRLIFWPDGLKLGLNILPLFASSLCCWSRSQVPACHPYFSKLCCLMFLYIKIILYYLHMPHHDPDAWLGEEQQEQRKLFHVSWNAEKVHLWLHSGQSEQQLTSPSWYFCFSISTLKVKWIPWCLSSGRGMPSHTAGTLINTLKKSSLHDRQVDFSAQLVFLLSSLL